MSRAIKQRGFERSPASRRVMDPSAAESLFVALRECGLYTPDQLAAIPAAAAAAGSDLDALSEGLHAKGLLTPYQSRKVRFNRISEIVFGKYLVLDKVGEGGMGKVYKAIERGPGRVVALKVVRAHLMQNKVIRGRYHREVAAAAALKHPNIVTLLDDGEANGRYYLAMEFVDGSDLSRMVKEFGRLPYQEACEYVRQAALGLKHAHDQGLIHRDIKPSNLLVCGERALPGTGGKATVKILDMGLVLAIDAEADPDRTELTRDGTVVGTPDYMAPEQAKNSSTVDHRADLYSLGCTLYTLISGRPPFPDGTPIDKLLRHQLEPPTDLKTLHPDLPAGVAALAGRLLAKKPGQRFGSAGELAEALVPFTPDAVPEVDPFIVPKKSGRRRKADQTRTVVPGGSTVTLGLAGSMVPSGPVAVATRTPDTNPVPVPKGPVVIVRRVDASHSSGTIPAPVFPDDAEPIDAEPIDAEPVDSGTVKSEPVRVKVEAKPARRESKPRKPARRPARAEKSGGTRLVLLAGVVLGVVVLIATAVAFALRSGNRGDASPLPAPKTDPGPNAVRGAPAAGVLPPPTVSLPDGAAAVAVIYPRELWRKADLRPGSRSAVFLNALEAKYRFDPRRFQRLTVAFPPGGDGRFVVVGEGGRVEPTWAADLELAGKAKSAAADGQSLLTFPPTTDPVFGAAVADRGIAVGTDRAGVASVAGRAVPRRPAAGIAPDVLAALPGSDGPDPPAIAFAADGRFVLPEVGPLARQGVESTTVKAWLRDSWFEVEIYLTGPDKEQIKDFVSITLWEKLVAKYPAVRPFLSPVTQLDGQTFEARGSQVRMRLSGRWEFAEFQDWVEKFIPAGKE